MSCNKFVNTTLGNIAQITMGQSPKGSSLNKFRKGVPFIQGNRTFGFLYPTIDTYTSSPVKNASKGDILFSVRAPVGDINIAQDDLCIGRGICAIKSKTGENGFLFYLLKNNVKRLISQANGTVFISVNRGDLESFEVVIPSSPDYRTRISNILSTIDRKIKLNNQINNNLPTHPCNARIAAKQRRQTPKTDECLHTDGKVSNRGGNEETAKQFSSLLAA